jgi:hypothetical protein
MNTAAQMSSPFLVSHDAIAAILAASQTHENPDPWSRRPPSDLDADKNVQPPGYFAQEAACGAQGNGLDSFKPPSPNALHQQAVPYSIYALYGSSSPQGGGGLAEAGSLQPQQTAVVG